MRPQSFSSRGSLTSHRNGATLPWRTVLEYCMNVAIDNKVKYGLLIKSIKHVRLLKDSWIRNNLWKNVWLGELLPFFKKCLVFIQSASVVTKHVGEKNLLWGSPKCFEARDSGFYRKFGARSRSKLCAGCGIPKITLGITGLHEISGQDYGIEEPYWGPSLVTSIALSAWKLVVHLVSFLMRSEQIIWCSSRNTWKNLPNPEPSFLFRFRVDDIVGSDSYEIINEDILGNGGMLSQQL